MPAPDSVLALCETFAAHREHYRSTAYNETELRREFLDPLFKALGWDIDNEQGYADAYKDVIHEDAIKVGGITKAPDYCFRIGGTRKFFLEAKKPSVNIKADISPAYQLRRYAWSAKLPLSVLSDFEEFAIYDCRAKPFPKDKPSVSRTFYCTFSEYGEKWDEIAAIFSREAVLKGSFDKYADSTKGKRGTAEVDADFLAEIERWRELLARNFALRNPSLTVRDLNFAVQKTIDRIIFLRICEDRGTEDYERLRKRLSGKDLYPILLEEFKRADDRYNSGLFHFTSEKGRADAPDTLTTALALDDKVLADIVKNLYYPDSSFEFSVMPADILGQVYEQFLGKTIRLTTAHQAKIEEKPEVRKAGGVYYTPKYIVDHIVENTLGRLLNGRQGRLSEPSAAGTPDRRQGRLSEPSAAGITDGSESRPCLSVEKAAKLKVLDPACGSGSFLIVAYQYLLDWHRDQYTLDPATLLPDEAKAAKHAKGANPVIYQGNGGEWRLSISERKRILLNNIHGVDIDSQAVEVTKLSLLLKVLEGETSHTAQRDLFNERQRILPDLGANIQCGNSLIGPDFYNQPDLPVLDDEARYRINVFDWKAAFPKVFQQGGFDCVIGNPPYIRIQSLRETSPQESDFYLKGYKSAQDGNFDIYVCFIEKALDLLSGKGALGYIVPHKFFSAKYGKSLRRILAKGEHTRDIVSFGAEQVFDQATTYTCLYFATKEPNQRVAFQRAYNLPEWKLSKRDRFMEISSKSLGDGEWYLLEDCERHLLDSLRKRGTPLENIAVSISQGLKTGADPVFTLEVISQSPGLIRCFSKALNTEVELESAITLILCKGGDMAAYQKPHPPKCVVYPYRDGKIIDPKTLATEFPKAWEYFLSCRKLLDAREKGRFAGSFFYQFSRAQCIKQSHLPKLLTPDIAPRPRFAIDQAGECAYLGGVSGGYGVIFPEGHDPLFYLGILNSNLTMWFIRATSTVFRGGWFSFEKRYIGQLPIRAIDFTSAADVELHGRMVGLVESMLALHARRAAERNPDTQRMLQTEITATDRRIDRLVYELYALTEEEIALVEG